MPIFTQQMGLVGIFAKGFDLPSEAEMQSSVGDSLLSSGEGEWHFRNGIIVRKRLQGPEVYRLEVEGSPPIDQDYTAVSKVFQDILPSGKLHILSMGINSLSVAMGPSSGMLSPMVDSIKDDVLFKNDTRLTNAAFQFPWDNAVLNVKITEQPVSPTYGESLFYIIDTNFDFQITSRKEVQSTLSPSKIMNITKMIGYIFQKFERNTADGDSD